MFDRLLFLIPLAKSKFPIKQKIAAPIPRRGEVLSPAAEIYFERAPGRFTCKRLAGANRPCSQRGYPRMDGISPPCYRRFSAPSGGTISETAAGSDPLRTGADFERRGYDNRNYGFPARDRKYRFPGHTPAVSKERDCESVLRKSPAGTCAFCADQRHHFSGRRQGGYRPSGDLAKPWFYGGGTAGRVWVSDAAVYLAGCAAQAWSTGTAKAAA